jgi:hypothetical protein
MSKELEELDYFDALLALYDACVQYGARKVLQDFHVQFPKMFEEVLVQINRIEPEEKLPALLKPYAGPM